MNCRLALACGISAVVVSSLFVLARSRADDEKPRADFGGQFLGVFHKRVAGDAAATTTYLAKPEVRKLGEKAFLVGARFEIVDPEPMKHSAAIWIALDEVSGIMPFPSLASIQEYFGPKRQP